MGNPNQIDLGGNTLVVTDIVLASTPGGAQTSLSATEIAALDGVTAGTVTASKALVVDSNLDLASLRNLTATNLDLGLTTGTAGSLDIFPGTTTTGKTSFTATANSGNTTTTINTAAQASTRTYTVPDAGASTANFVLSTGTSTATSATSAELTQLAGSSSTPTASKAVIATASGWQAVRRPVVEDGAAVVLGAVDSGALCIFDKTDGAQYTLPTPAIGLWYEFIVAASVTSGTYKVITNAGSVFIIGTANMLDSDSSFAITQQDANGTTIVAVTQNSASTNASGGIKGGHFKLTCRSATQWAFEGEIVHAGTVATPFATS